MKTKSSKRNYKRNPYRVHCLKNHPMWSVSMALNGEDVWDTAINKAVASLKKLAKDNPCDELLRIAIRRVRSLKSFEERYL